MIELNMWYLTNYSQINTLVAEGSNIGFPHQQVSKESRENDPIMPHTKPKLIVW